MILHSLLVAHVAVLGYWLGAELVINSTFRFVAWSARMPFPERDRLMAHVLDADQHVRYALVLQLGLGVALAALLGYLPGGATTALAAAAFATAWLILVEVVHRLRRTDSGRQLAALDRAIRYGLIAGLLVVAGSALTGRPGLPAWLAWKLALFAAVIACGLGIRGALVAYFVIWDTVRETGSTPLLERLIRRLYWRATAILGGLWMLIGAIVGLSILRPG